MNSLLGVKVARADDVALNGHDALDGESVWVCWWSVHKPRVLNDWVIGDSQW